MHPATAFGSSWSTPATAAAVLRAQAAAVVSLSPLSAEDAAAAVIGAHLWATVTGENTLGSSARHSTAAIHAATSILARAAGHLDDQDSDQVGADLADALDRQHWRPSPRLAAVEEALAQALNWAQTQLAPERLPDVLRSAGWDLCTHLLALPSHESTPRAAESESVGLSHAAALLAAHAEELAGDITPTH